MDYEDKNKIDGEKRAREIRERLKMLITNSGIVPNIAIIQVGNDFASDKYVKRKIKVSAELGIRMTLFHFEERVAECDILSKIQELNNDKSMHGIMCQLPLPKHLNTFNILNTISPEKDIDGLTPFNAGLLHYSQVVPYIVDDVLNDKIDNNLLLNLGKNVAFIPCTPLGCLDLISKTFEEENKEIKGKNAVVIGNSNLVGKPMSRLLTQSGATTTTLHSKSSNIDYAIKNADVIVSATGVGQVLKKIKKDAILIDVAIRDNGKGGICGDLDYEKFIKKHKITPVPKGVGPMTIACLMVNSYLACLHNEKR